MDWAWGRCHPPRRRHPGRGRVLTSSFSDPAVGGEFSTDFTWALMSLLARLGWSQLGTCVTSQVTHLPAGGARMKSRPSGYTCRTHQWAEPAEA